MTIAYPEGAHTTYADEQRETASDRPSSPGMTPSSPIGSAGNVPEWIEVAPDTLALRMRAGLVTSDDAWAELSALPGFLDDIAEAEAQDDPEA